MIYSLSEETNFWKPYNETHERIELIWEKCDESKFDIFQCYGDSFILIEGRLLGKRDSVLLKELNKHSETQHLLREANGDYDVENVKF